jgi:hypothetical protein
MGYVLLATAFSALKLNRRSFLPITPPSFKKPTSVSPEAFRRLPISNYRLAITALSRLISTLVSEIPSTDLRWACRLRVSSAVALLGISLLRFVTEDDPSLTPHKKALQPLSLRREPTQKSCFPRPKTVFVQQTWFIFYGRALPCCPSGLFFPPFSRSYPW